MNISRLQQTRVPAITTGYECDFINHGNTIQTTFHKPLRILFSFFIFRLHFFILLVVNIHIIRAKGTFQDFTYTTPSTTAEHELCFVNDLPITRGFVSSSDTDAIIASERIERVNMILMAKEGFDVTHDCWWEVVDFETAVQRGSEELMWGFSEGESLDKEEDLELGYKIKRKKLTEMASLWFMGPWKVFIHTPFSASHTINRRSLPPLTRYLPSDDNARVRTSSQWPLTSEAEVSITFALPLPLPFACEVSAEGEGLIL